MSHKIPSSSFFGQITEYSVFRQFWQAKFAYGGSILSSSQFCYYSKATKNDARYKSGQNWLKNNHLATSI